MKKLIITLLLLCIPAFASEVIPPRMIVRQLAEAVQHNNTEVIDWYFVFDEKEHGSLTPLSREEQLNLLQDLSLDLIKFDKDEYDVDEGEQFVVSIVSPQRIDFVMRHLELDGKIGPFWMYVVVAIREGLTHTQTYTVEHVIDGDIIKLTNGETVRLLGIDCPENEYSPAEAAYLNVGKKWERTSDDIKKVKEAAEFVRGLGLEGRDICLMFDVQKKDKSGRLLTYVTIGGMWNENNRIFKYDDAFQCGQAKAALTVFLNRLIIKEGYAQPMTIPPNVKYADLFKELYQEARENKRGLWKEDK